MIHIAIVEDEEEIATQIKEYIFRFMRENDLTYSVNWFSSAESFLFTNINEFDIILLDIQLPNMDCYSMAKNVREINSFVTIIFVTSLAQYALKGYEVGALDFMVKPVTYYNFALKFHRAINSLKKNLDDTLSIHSKTQMNVVKVSDIYFVEIVKHTVSYHTKKGIFTTTGTMKKVCEQLAKFPFSLCNQCYLINLKHVMQVNNNVVIVANHSLSISRPRKKEFMHDLNEYLSGHALGE